MALLRHTLVISQEVQAALATLLSGISVDDLQGGAPVVVPVFQEETYPASKRTYPRITIELQRTNPNFEDEELDPEVYEKSYNDTLDPPERTMGALPQAKRLVFQIKAWAVSDTIALRQMQGEINSRMPHRGFLTIPKRVPEDVERTLWLFQNGGEFVYKDPNEDQVLYQAAWTYDIPCEIEQGTDTVEKVVTEIDMTLSLGGTPELESDTLVLYRQFLFDATGFTPL